MDFQVGVTNGYRWSGQECALCQGPVKRHQTLIKSESCQFNQHGR